MSAARCEGADQSRCADREPIRYGYSEDCSSGDLCVCPDESQCFCDLDRPEGAARVTGYVYRGRPLCRITLAVEAI